MEKRITVIAGVIGAIALGGLAWALCTQPLTPEGTYAGSGSAAGSARAAESAAAGSQDAGPAPVQAEAPDAGAGGPSAAGDASPGDTAGQAGSPSAGTGNGSGSQGSAPKPAGGSGSGSKPSGGGSQAPSGGQEPKPQAQACQHDWVEQGSYQDVWVSKWEDVTIEEYRCNTCGEMFYSLSDINAHLDSTIDWDTMTGHAGYTGGKYTNKVDNGSYQKQWVGNGTYKCSKCGATK